MSELSFQEIREKFKNNPTVEINSKDSIYSGCKGQVVDVAGQRVKVSIHTDIGGPTRWYNYKNLRIVDYRIPLEAKENESLKNPKIAVFVSISLDDMEEYTADSESFIVRGENLEDILEKYARAMQEDAFEMDECVIYEGQIYRLQQKVAVETI